MVTSLATKRIPGTHLLFTRGCCRAWQSQTLVKPSLYKITSLLSMGQDLSGRSTSNYTRSVLWELFLSLTRRNEALNFCVQKPTGFMRLAAYAGTTAFIGILGYMVYEKSRLEALVKKDREQPWCRSLHVSLLCNSSQVARFQLEFPQVTNCTCCCLLDKVLSQA